MQNPATERKRSRRGRAGLWRRATQTTLLLGAWGAVIIAAGLLLNKAWHPIGMNRQLKADLEATCAEIARTERERDALKRRERYLNTPEGIQAEARKLGYIKEGEMPLRLQEPPAPKPAPKAAETNE
jgi:cell division protein FtsB